jgi:hypothetical protein
MPLSQQLLAISKVCAVNEHLLNLAARIWRDKGCFSYQCDGSPEDPGYILGYFLRSQYDDVLEVVQRAYTIVDHIKPL